MKANELSRMEDRRRKMEERLQRHKSKMEKQLLDQQTKMNASIESLNFDWQKNAEETQKRMQKSHSFGNPRSRHSITKMQLRGMVGEEDEELRSRKPPTRHKSCGKELQNSFMSLIDEESRIAQKRLESARREIEELRAQRRQKEDEEAKKKRERKERKEAYKQKLKERRAKESEKKEMEEKAKKEAEKKAKKEARKKKKEEEERKKKEEFDAALKKADKNMKRKSIDSFLKQETEKFEDDMQSLDDSFSASLSSIRDSSLRGSQSSQRGSQSSFDPVSPMGSSLRGSQSSLVSPLGSSLKSLSSTPESRSRVSSSQWHSFSGKFDWEGERKRQQKAHSKKADSTKKQLQKELDDIPGRFDWSAFAKQDVPGQ